MFLMSFNQLLEIIYLFLNGLISFAPSGYTFAKLNIDLSGTGEMFRRSSSNIIK